MRSRLGAWGVGAALAAFATVALAAAIPPAPTRWVTDDVGFLSPATRDALDRRLEAYERGTGHQVIVWIGKTIGNDSLEPWAATTFKAWGIGKKGKDDGAVLFILADDRKARIEVGYGLEGQLPDIEAARIMRDELTRRLRGGDRDGAVTAAVSAMLAAIGGEPGGAPPLPPQPVAPGLGLGQLILYGVVAIIFLGILVTHPSLAAYLLMSMMSGGGGGRRGGGGGFSGGGFGGGSSGGGGGGGFSGGGGSSGGGGASGSW